MTRWATSQFLTPWAASLTTVNAIDDTGNAAGTYAVNGGIDHGFISDALGNITTFDPSGSFDTFPTAIDNGMVAGYFDGAGTHGFIRDAAGNITLIDVPGSVATLVTSLNDSGWVGGDYEDSSGVFHGFIAVPKTAAVPELPSMQMWVFGLIAFRVLSSLAPKRTPK
ncbi:MAG TPA: hypothetical protein VJ783_06985 [Pirellulales bacterium]|nr:hypothetical protein [Pirellulales bacterium]